MKKIYTTILTTLLTIATYAQSPHAAQLYGMTQYGSNASKGSIFHYTPSTNTFTNDYNFQIKAKGRTPKCEIVSGNNGKYYGTATAGGDYNSGVLFEWDSITSVYKDLHNFTSKDGKDPRGGMVLYNNKLYGTTNEGGANNCGVIYEWDMAANTYTIKIDLDSIAGKNPTGSLTVLNNIFYGFTSSGGLYNKGVLFEWNPATNIYTKQFDFDSIIGSNPIGKLAFFNGMFYAMCNTGGTFNVGTIYEWDYVNNLVTKTFDFNNTNGAFPAGYLSLYNNKFYGTTYDGGIYQTIGLGQHFGVIFEYNPASNAFVKKKDLGFQGSYRGPLGALTLKDNIFWGTATSDFFGGGGIFTWDPATNELLAKYSFSANTALPCEVTRQAIGTMPFESLLLSGNYLLGSASEKAGNDFGTLFKYAPDSNRVVSLVNMEATDGAYPKGALTKVGNKLYGLTYQGGNSHAGNIFEWDLTTQQFKERFQLDGFTTGIWPKGSLTWHNSKLYGINTYGKLVAENPGFNQREVGDYFSWDPVTNQYQSLLSANYARCTPVLFNNKFYTPTEIASQSNYSAINAFDPATNTLTEVALMDPNVGAFYNYQDIVSANGVTYYNGKFYGMTPAKYGSGDSPFRGAIYEWDTTSTAVTLKYDFIDSLGTYPTGNLLLVGNEFYGLTSNYANFTGSYPSLFKWNPATNVFQKKSSLSQYAYGTPTYSGGKIYFLTESSYLYVHEYDPILDTLIVVYNEPIPLFQLGGNWNFSNCVAPPSYQQLLEVIPNIDPILSSFPGTQTVCSNQNNMATFIISDADNDTMTFQIASMDTSLIPITNISITNMDSVYTINYVAVNNQTGTTTITITAHDGYGGSVNFSFMVNVNATPNIGITQDSTSLTPNQNGASYQWIDCNSNTAIVGENNQIFIATTTGNYAVEITNNNCSDTSACIEVLVNTVGMLESTNYNTFYIYPNPTSSQFTVLLPTENASIIVTNIMGQEMINEQAKQKMMTLQIDKSGVYFVYVKTKQGTSTQKLIVNH